MKELKLESSLTDKEIEDNFKNIDFFEGLKQGLEEAVQYSKGNKSEGIKVRKRTLPDVNVKETRESLSMTQKSFARALGVSCRTVEAWESGKSNPNPTAKKLMYLINEDHSLIGKLQSAG